MDGWVRERSARCTTHHQPQRHMHAAHEEQNVEARWCARRSAAGTQEFYLVTFLLGDRGGIVVYKDKNEGESQLHVSSEEAKAAAAHLTRSEQRVGAVGSAATFREKKRAEEAPLHSHTRRGPRAPHARTWPGEAPRKLNERVTENANA